MRVRVLIPWIFLYAITLVFVFVHERDQRKALLALESLPPVSMLGTVRRTRRDSLIDPLYGLVLVRRVEEPTKSRIITPDSAKKKSQKAQVVAVGPGRYSTTGTVLPCMVKVGDIVLMSEWAGIGTEVRHMDEDMLLVKEEAILAILR